MDLYAVTGRPVLHSKSPQMQNAAFAALRIHARYLRIAAGSAQEALATAAILGVKGMNITSPLKDEFAAAAHTLDSSVGKAASVNCITIMDGKITGYNTDTYGAAQALLQNGVKLKGARACVLGAGGAARSALAALLGEGAQVTVMNRTEGKAKEIAQTFGCPCYGLSGSDLEKIIPGADVVVSALSTSEEIIPAGLLQSGSVVLDANYSSASKLSQAAAKKGCRVIDGKEWLLFQGAKSFEIFTGKKAPIGQMRAALYAGPQPAGAAVAKPARNIVLTGFMGTGKSSVAREIAKISGMKAVDTDAGIEKKARATISEIFAASGEQAFRALERSEIAALAGSENCAIACGGGAVLDPQNVPRIRALGIVVLLCAGIPAILGHIKNPASRPLLAKGSPEDAAGRLFSQRIPAYAGACDLVVGTKGKTAHEIAEVVLREANYAQ